MSLFRVFVRRRRGPSESAYITAVRHEMRQYLSRRHRADMSYRVPLCLSHYTAGYQYVPDVFLGHGLVLQVCFRYVIAKMISAIRAISESTQRIFP